MREWKREDYSTLSLRDGETILAFVSETPNGLIVYTPENLCSSQDEAVSRVETMLAAVPDKWTPIEDDLPPPEEDVLVLNGSLVKQAWLDGDRGEFRDDDGKRLHNVTHWRPLPATPEQ